MNAANKRILLIVAVLALPALFTWLITLLTIAIFAFAQRILSPQILVVLAGAEFTGFTLVAIIEARERW